MRMSLDRKTVVAMLAIVALVAVVVAMRDDPPTGSTGAPPNRSSTNQTPAGSVDVDDVRLEVLKEHPAEIAEGERNPFRFQARPAPPPPPRIAEPPPPVASALPQLPEGPPPPPPIALRFIGLMEAPTQVGRVAVLSDGRGNVFYGKEGDVIEGRYRLLKISPETAELAHIDGRGRQTIRLSGQ